MKTKLTILALGVLLTATQAQTNYQRIKSFGIPELSGTYPQSPLIEGSDGKLYGTSFGLEVFAGTGDAGTVFKLNKDGRGYTVLHSFTYTGRDGSNPQAGLVEGSDGGRSMGPRLMAATTAIAILAAVHCSN